MRTGSQCALRSSEGALVACMETIVPTYRRKGEYFGFISQILCLFFLIFKHNWFCFRDASGLTMSGMEGMTTNPNHIEMVESVRVHLSDKEEGPPVRECIC